MPQESLYPSKCPGGSLQDRKRLSSPGIGDFPREILGAREQSLGVSDFQGARRNGEDSIGRHTEKEDHPI